MNICVLLIVWWFQPPAKTGRGHWEQNCLQRAGQEPQMERVGKRVKVYFEPDDRWYFGYVKSFSSRRGWQVVYDTVPGEDDLVAYHDLDRLEHQMLEVGSVMAMPKKKTISKPSQKPSQKAVAKAVAKAIAKGSEQAAAEAEQAVAEQAPPVLAELKVAEPTLFKPLKHADLLHPQDGAVLAQVRRASGTKVKLEDLLASMSIFLVFDVFTQLAARVPVPFAQKRRNSMLLELDVENVVMHNTKSRLLSAWLHDEVPIEQCRAGQAYIGMMMEFIDLPQVVAALSEGSEFATALRSVHLAQCTMTLRLWDEAPSARPIPTRRFKRYGRHQPVRSFPIELFEKLASHCRLPVGLPNEGMRALLLAAPSYDPEKHTWGDMGTTLNLFGGPFLSTMALRRVELEHLFTSPLQLDKGGAGTAAWFGRAGMDSETGLTSMRQIDWATFSEPQIERHLELHPQDAAHAGSARALLSQLCVRDAIFENMACESQRHLDLFDGAVPKFAYDTATMALLSTADAAAYINSLLA